MSNDTYLTVNETAAKLKVSPRTVRNYLIRAVDPLPHSKPVGRILIAIEDLRRWTRKQSPL